MQRSGILPLFIAGLLLVGSLPAVLCSGGKRVLALIGSDEIRSSHSKFFKGLQDAGLELDIRSHKDNDLQLRDYDEWKYDHLLVFAPKASSEFVFCSCRLTLFGSQLTSN